MRHDLEDYVTVRSPRVTRAGDIAAKGCGYAKYNLDLIGSLPISQQNQPASRAGWSILVSMIQLRGRSLLPAYLTTLVGESAGALGN